MSSESQYVYDGPLSTFTEWDALLYGVTAGIVLTQTPISRDIAREPSKFLGGVAAGSVVAHIIWGD